jgi:hypothetical protein
VDNPQRYVWDRVRESYTGVDSVLRFEADLTASFPSDRKFSYEARGNVEMKTYSRDFSKAYSDMLDGQVERRMRTAVRSIGSFWLTAWINAGQPDLDKLIPKKPSEADRNQIKEELIIAPNPAVNAREHEN